MFKSGNCCGRQGSPHSIKPVELDAAFVAGNHPSFLNPTLPRSGTNPIPLRDLTLEFGFLIV
jgi:hypothetical protein